MSNDLHNAAPLNRARRSALFGGAGLAAVAAAIAAPLAGLSGSAQAASSYDHLPEAPLRKTASTFTTRDGVDIYYKDWGHGQPIVFCHGWPLNSDSWESQMFHLANNGFRVIAHDRRGHGRSSQPWDGNDMDHYADDLAQLIDVLNLKNVILLGFSTGGGEVARYVGRHGTRRVAKLGLISAVPPLMLKTADNPDGLPLSVFDGIRAASQANRSQLYLDLASGPFYGYNRPGAKPSQGIIQSWWMQGMMGGHKNTYDSIKAFSETDFRADLQKFDKPTLIIHGDDDQIVPIGAAGKASAAIVKHARLLVYAGAPHGLTDTHKDKVNADLLAFARS
ncbi:alpha/beta fold hydrolase [Janthinobacterium agaricidamnosum]|uniref:Non-heme chloroperoxidase n=1 Tax=Janthinobacterium agaricidamnosum NBRC 102515 = DSM 9628 TaxID=1349767 RepID=W0VAZ5_9BURK|nr:alpha/beta hydrolase [Janthinobacterium agaricidamnosum]CDG85959.1 non-heme chloroperoxidase [Janthinobacterium agaricidamnosum NBRC 102515 = DSM 9628]